MRPLLRSYLFVKCETRVEPWQMVTSARGVHRLLGRDGRPIPISDRERGVIKFCETEAAEKAVEREWFKDAARELRDDVEARAFASQVIRDLIGTRAERYFGWTLEIAEGERALPSIPSVAAN